MAEEPRMLSMLELYETNAELFVQQVLDLGCPDITFVPGTKRPSDADLARMTSWLFNNIAGGRGSLQTLKQDATLSDDQADRAKSRLKQTGWTHGMRLATAGPRNVLAGNCGTYAGTKYMLDAIIAVMNDPWTPHKHVRVLASRRPLDKRDDKHRPVADNFSSTTMMVLDAYHLPLVDEWTMAVASMIERGFGLAGIIKHDDGNPKHAVLVSPLGRVVKVICVPNVGVKPANTTASQKWWHDNYPEDFTPGMRLTLAGVRLSARAFAAAAMELAELQPTMHSIEGVCMPIWDDELNSDIVYTIQFINEIVNILAKALQAIINDLRRKAGRKLLSSTEVRERLDNTNLDDPNAWDQFVPLAAAF
jgi:hypothetical protein